VLGFLARLVRAAPATVVLAALLAGLPRALTHFVGWPLPDHLPSWAEVQGVLLSPMTATFLVDFLACLTWLAWACFTLDVARCAVDIARGARVPGLAAAGPVHRTAAVLVGAVLISLLSRPAGPPPTPTAAGESSGTEVVAAAPAWNQAPEQPTARARPATRTPSHRTAPAAGEQPVGVKSAVVLPYDPETGVYDSLWRMAERTLGDGTRWPEIYELNKGKPQPGGGTFTRPGLVFPGEEMALPHDATVPAPPPSRPSPPPSAPVTPPPTATTPPPGSPTTPEPSTTAQPPVTTQAPATTPVPRTAQRPATPAPPSTHASGEPGLSWGDGVFVGLGLASAVSTALVMARRRHRRRYRPGSGERSDLPVAPVVYRLHLAHLRAEQDGHDPDADDEPGQDRPGRRPRRASAPPIVLGHDSTFDDQAPVLPVGVRDGRQIALNLAAAHGLGLLGAGATGAARALLVTALSTADRAARVIVAAEDLAALVGRRPAQAPLPASLHVAADLDAALDLLEAETLVRIGQRPTTGRPWRPVVLVARTPGRRARRVQAVLDNGSAVGVTGLLLGQWNSGVSAYVCDDGIISATSPGLGEPLRGTRVFRLGDDHTADLLALLHRAVPDDPTECERTAGNPPPPAPPPHPPVVSDAPAGGTGPESPAAFDDAGRPDGPDLEILATACVALPASRWRPDRSARTGGEPRGDRTPPSTDPGRQPNGEPHHDTAIPERAVPPVPVRISVLGPPRVWWRPGPAGSDNEGTEREITSAFQPRLRELLVFLALHPDGASREALIAALWATSPPERTTNAMNTSLSRLRRALTAAAEGSLSELVLIGEGRYRLDPDLVEVDYWSFAAAVTARRAATTDHQRVRAYRHIVDSYRGPLADGMSTEWIETAREAIRRDAIDAVAALARALVEHDPQQTLDLLEIARAFDPHNELIYRDIMRLQDRLGQLDAIPRTLALLTTRLAEVDDRPTPQAVDLAERLCRRHDAATDPDNPLGADRGHSKAG